MITITIQYFALLREQRGLTEERLATAAATPAALYEELRARHGFSLPGDRVRVELSPYDLTRGRITYRLK